jgi:predicted polyphosphate/ATP-dependent NAD kinase
MTMEVVPLDMKLTGLQEDSEEAARIMQEMGVDCIVTLGGDGTNRVVARGCGDIPLVPISTGTNNVFPKMIEGTIAGLAAGAVACGFVSDAEIIRTKKLHILNDDTEINTALIDAVVLNDTFIGSRAIWDENHLKQIIVTRGEPDTIGISSIAGNLEPIDIREEKGLYINVGNGKITVDAPIAPGLIRRVPIEDYKIIALLEKVPVIDGPCTIALDGEREVEVGEGDRYFIQLKLDGPRVVDTHSALREAVKSGYAIKGK